ncbi:MAG: hypothetical protein ACE37H_09565 [Phycisphaeraceae bacterium]
MLNATTRRAQKQARYRCEHARPGDADAIRRLLEQPMPGKVSFAMTHGADHRAAAMLASEHVCEVVVRDRSKPAPTVVGYGYRAVRPVYLNGTAARVGYLGGLRCDRALRAAFRVLGGAFDTLSGDREADEAPFDLTSIMADNAVVRRGLEKGLPGLPVYVPIGEMATLTLRTKRHGRLDKRVRAATDRDTVLIQSLLDVSAPRYHGRQAWGVSPGARRVPGNTPAVADFLVYEGDHDDRGCLALWDQRADKQIVIADLHPTLRRLRHAINLAGFATGRPRLPGAGRRLNMAYASHAGFDLDHHATASALIAGVCTIAARRGIELISFGLPADAPLLPRLARRFKPWVSRSVIYAVADRGVPVNLDKRPVWMEVATL